MIIEDEVLSFLKGLKYKSPVGELGLQRVNNIENRRPNARERSPPMRGGLLTVGQHVDDTFAIGVDALG